MKILAFGASNSQKSINKNLATYVAKFVKEKIANSELEIIDLNDYECSIFSPERNENYGIPEEIERFQEKIESSDVIIISFAEYNGSYTTAFKNIFDWASVKKNAFLENKKMILLSTSHGARGALTVLESAKMRLPKHGAKILGSLHVPFYSSQFDENNNSTNKDTYIAIMQLVELI